MNDEIREPQVYGASSTPPVTARKRRVETKAGSIALWDTGHGDQTVIFIHGNSSSKAAFRAQFDGGLASRYRLIALDLPGHGESSDARDPARDYTIPAYARLVREIAHLAGVHAPVLVGWSLGGHLAIEAAGQDMTLQGMVLTGTPPVGPGPADIAETFRAVPALAVTTQEAPTTEELELYAHTTYGAGPLPEELLQAVRRCDGRSRSLFAEHWFSGREGSPQRQVVANWPHPIAVIQGQDEPFFDNALLERMQWGRLWEGKIHLVVNSGHAPFREQPAAYNALLMRFLGEAWPS